MRLEKLHSLSEELLDELLNIWERSVRSSHHFLKEEDIAFFKPLVRNNYFPSVDLFIIRNVNEQIVAFMGLSEDMLEMLFVAPEEQGHGYGKAFINFAVNECNIRNVDVNEDNRQAYQFYKHMGYEVIGRDELDSSGKPFPILHLHLAP